jgi:hypothetical protein
MDGIQNGPYTLKELMELCIFEDTEVLEVSIGEWHVASDYPFNEMYLKEYGILLPEGSILPAEDTPTSGHMGNNNSQLDFGEYLSQINGSNNTAKERLSGWNWGAFFLGWIWGLGHKIYWPLAAILLAFIPTVGFYLCLGVSVYLGIYGTEKAWALSDLNRDDFIERERKWAIAGFIAFILSVIFGCFYYFVRQ